EQEDDFDNQDDDDGEFEDETAGLVELVHHEAIELASSAEFLLDQTAVIGNAHFGRNQVVEACIEHIAEEFDGVVDFFRKLHDVEANGIAARGLSREAQVSEAAALVFKETITAVEHTGEQTVVVAKLKKLGVGVFEQLNRGGRHFPAAVNDRTRPTDDQKVVLRVGDAGLQDFRALDIGERDRLATDEFGNFTGARGKQFARGQFSISGPGDLLQIDDVIVLGEPGVVWLQQGRTRAGERGAKPFGGACLKFGAADELAGLQHQRVPLGFKRQIQFDADDPIVVVFGAACDAAAVGKAQRFDGLGDWRALETKIVRDRRNATGGRFRAARLPEGTQAIEVNGFRHLVEIENPETTAYGNDPLRATGR